MRDPVDTGRTCAYCGDKIMTREAGSGRHPWRYCKDEHRIAAQKERVQVRGGRRPITRVKSAK